MQVTISLLPVSLSLVHIPRSRLDSLSHPILRQLLHPNPAFLNITCNEIELSLFAEHHMLKDFEPIARKDRHKQRSRSGSASSRKGVASQVPLHEPVEISYDNWSVLQIDSHNDQIDNSGTRVYDLSAPLAAAGISILYQSSYMSDFIFVKESRLREAMDLFESAGFCLYTSDSDHPISPSYSPITDDPEYVPNPTQNMGAVLTRNMGDLSVNKKSSSETPTEVLPTGSQSPRHKSHSPTSGEVRMLQPDLACVGLSDELGVDHWGLKIVKLVAFPDLIPSSDSPSSASISSSSYPTSKRSTMDDRSAPSYPPRTPAVDIISAASLFSKHRHRTGSSASCSSCSSSSSSEEDGYFSHSPQNVSTTSLTTAATTTTSRSYSDLQALACSSSASSSSYKTPPSKHLVAHIAPMSPITPKQHPLAVPPPLSLYTDSAATPTRTVLSPKSYHPHPHQQQVPFFSFTRTPEGSSLTADVNVLATLFPPHERHMVICGGELDAADARLERQRASRSRRGTSSLESSSDEEDVDVEDGEYPSNGNGSARSRSASSSEERSEGNSSGALKCLQIDLRRFGLDKHGLVNRFSRVLEENGINHMYSSTFKTANLLVDKSDAVRAQSLLRSC